jgi:dihydrolipoamide dehydrogenase
LTILTDVLVIGAGPGGYVAAIRAGQLGKKVVLVEKDKLGGVCLNYGCIPSKALINFSKLVKNAKRASSIGLSIDKMEIDISKVQTWKNSIVNTLANGIAGLCKSNKVEVIYGKASFISSNQVEVRGKSTEEIVEAKSIIIATGSLPIELPGFKIDGKKIISSTEALDLDSIPMRLLIIGGGVIGLEIGMMYANLGTHLIVVEIMDQILPGLDPELVNIVSRNLQKVGAEVYVKSQAKNWVAAESGVRVAIESSGREMEISADYVLESVGRRPNTEGLGLEKIGIETNQRGFIKVNKKMQTNVPNVYAIGDVLGGPFLAHKASKEGIVAAEAIAGLPSENDFVTIPSAIFTDPEIGIAGLSETEAKSRGYEVQIGKFPFAASARALSTNEGEGFVKVMADKASGLILGVEIVGPQASDLISEATLALEMGATLEDVSLTVHPHPTLPESFMESAENALGHAIHIPNRRS